MLTVDDCFHSYHRDDFYLAVTKRGQWTTSDFFVIANAILILIIKPDSLVLC